MCDPTGGVLTVGLILAAVQGGIAGAQAETQVQTAKRSQKAIQQGEVIQQRQLVERQGQESAAADERVNQVNLDTQRAESLAITMAGEAGVSGNSTRAQLRAIRAQGLRGVTAVERNEAWASRQLGYEAQGVRARSSRQQLALNYGPGAAVGATQGSLSGLGSGLQLGSGLKEAGIIG